jgi:hypothetical protein
LPRNSSGSRRALARRVRRITPRNREQVAQRWLQPQTPFC